MEPYGVRIKPAINSAGERCVNISFEDASGSAVTQVTFNVPLPIAKAMAKYIVEICDDNSD